MGAQGDWTFKRGELRGGGKEGMGQKSQQREKKGFLLREQKTIAGSRLSCRLLVAREGEQAARVTQLVSLETNCYPHAGKRKASQSLTRTKGYNKKERPLGRRLREETTKVGVNKKRSSAGEAELGSP